jgi:hypothetical protein
MVTEKKTETKRKDTEEESNFLTIRSIYKLKTPTDDIW